mmetsp:Transcript_3884/g.8774  ORF Transcript_3884/g.8774 Transcript_3884/m.8774 type:complete len:300 (-) Transcript_3884:366-1265(-)
MNILKKWAIVTRLESVTLAVTSIGLGSTLAAFSGSFSWRVGILAALTASLLQVICNLANDYGDFLHNADLINPIKPPSAIQTQLVTLTQVEQILPWLMGAAMGCGLYLLHTAKLTWIDSLAFVLLGILASIAAITYTLGKKPYGYHGWGDIAVFSFFGFLGVGGTFYLHTQQHSSVWLWPTISYGSMTVGILNVNNIRDLSADKKANKNTLPVRIGRRTAIYYHWGLLTTSIVAILWFLLHYVNTPWPYTCLCVTPWLIKHGIAVSRLEVTQLTQQLQSLVCTVLIFVTLLSVGLLLGT